MARHLAKHVQKKKQKDLFDYLVYFFMVATPLFELPQAYDIYRNQDAANVSIFTWGFFLASDFVWLAYSIKNRLKPLIIMYCIYLLVEAGIVIGIFLYS